jgi:crotonobetainyl-CoA:carnitine CoA-transferase CaiB-like acyl-CoA transferase
VRNPPPKIGQHNEAALSDWDFSAEEIEKLKEQEVI